MPITAKQSLKNLGPHPIEGTQAFKDYINRPAIRNKRASLVALQRILRVVKHCSLDELTEVHVEHGVGILIGDGYAISYIDRSVRALRAFLNWAMRNRFVIGNAADGAPVPKDHNYTEPVVVPEPLLAKVQEHILANCTVEDVLMWAFLRAGCRISEPCAVRKGKLLIDPLAKLAYAIVGWKTAERKIKLPPWSYRHVAGWLDANSAADDEKLVLYLNGTPLDAEADEDTQTRQMDCRTMSASRRIDNFQTLALATDPAFNPKDMRSTFITKALRANPTQIAEIAKFVGNTPDILLKKYAHLFNQTDFSDQMG